MPVTLVVERFRFYESVSTPQDAAGTARTAEAILTAQLHEMVDAYGEVKSTLCSSRQRGDTLIVTLSAECQEEIGESVPIYTETTEETD